MAGEELSSVGSRFPGKVSGLIYLDAATAVAKLEAVLDHDNAEIANMPPLPPRSPIAAAVNFGMQAYTSIPVPALAIYGCPHNRDRLPDSTRKTVLISADKARCTEWADNFRRGVPSARVVMIPNADHYVYLSNEGQVAREMNDFLTTIP